MQDEIGLQFHLATMITMAAGFLAVVVGVLIFALLNFNKFTGNYNSAMTTAATGSIFELGRADVVTCPQVYSSLIEAGDEIKDVYYTNLDGSMDNKLIYSYDGKANDLIFLMTGSQTRMNTRVVVKQSGYTVPNISVYITEVGAGVFYK